MHRGDATKSPLNLVLVVLDLSPEGKKIFDLEKVCGLSGLRVERPHEKHTLRQCHRCQLYGHSALHCQSRPRCVKCLGDHGTSECTRTRDSPEPPSCILCGQAGHPANYRGCPAAPRPKRKVGKGNAQKGTRKVPNKPAFVAAPPPVVNHWTGLPTTEAFPPLRTRAPVMAGLPSATPAPALAPISKGPSGPSAHHSIAEDLALATKFAKNLPFDLQEVQLLARKLRQVSESTQPSLRDQMDHAYLLQILRSL
ncbi:hypothetical protein K1T71_008703 [Dendrolimus kikuchii]|uniref:Uncharacterized protein n=1 Tax=Dendrolimus kikuchii TaxID=765133 RepID=A0ACC1CV24_9NEOP|nr:hypothetical protein K1T71_008703 [Dendrolimus kikuchii]